MRLMVAALRTDKACASRSAALLKRCMSVQAPELTSLSTIVRLSSSSNLAAASPALAEGPPGKGMLKLLPPAGQPASGYQHALAI